VYQQTYAGLPVWEAAVAVQLLQNPYRVTSAQSTIHTDLRVELPREGRLPHLNEANLARSLGLNEKETGFNRDSLKIERQKWYIYRYEAAKRIKVPADLTGHTPEAEGFQGGYGHVTHTHRYPDLPPVNPEIKEGMHYLVSAVYFVLGTPEIPNLRWLALIEAETLSVLLLRAFVDSVNGFVFVQDPMTTNGGPLPNATDAQLNPLRRSVLLPGLAPPVGGNYALKGNMVELLDVEPPPIAPPTEPVGTDFNFNVRTDNFSATNAYYHCDKFFRLVAQLGFDVNVYFGGTLLPSTVDHR
jgi:hypothetical protein